MDTALQTEKPTGPKRTVRAKTKAGCRTCKIRKVKCDEGRPACHRCVSTGRVCDGYGIWRGGGNAYGTAERALNTLSQHLSQPSRSLGAIPGLNHQESHAFHFFRTKTVLKIRGVFGSDFWEQLVVQFSLREPAVLHAVIALAATHRRGIISGQIRRPFPDEDKPETAMDPSERLALEQYNKAIRYLFQHLKEKDDQSLRISLASCVVFTCIELIKGDIETSQVHFQNGVRLLQDCKSKSSADEHISEAFTRISIRPSIFGQAPDFPLKMPGSTSGSGPIIPCVFDAIGEARRCLDWLLHDINMLSTEADRVLQEVVQVPGYLVRRQERLQACTSSWLRAFSTSVPLIRKRLPDGNDDALTLGEPLLLLYHGMASIMVAMSLRGTDETAFDAYTPQFATILEHTIHLWGKVATAARNQLSCANPAAHDLSFTADMGFIPPLYYTALKCRVPRFRRRAVDFLVSTPHREGMWDGKMAAAIARKVIQLEEGDFYAASEIAFDQGELVLGVPADDLPLVPGGKRISDVSVMLPDHGMKVVIFCRRYMDGVRKTERVELDLGCAP
ncbi:hypothetical protein B0T25DRAFT_297720 [Lasiosphaeria hispida]|uniref:Zn(2)-C6 fungal-type domain-containing protein n=1 Tax=Lasiosphaeria hispida TaxID=260671 RepID=A0AAJ0HCT7_9PEZI|nr:hypothetical protein B0T25DRAFT_297720 [Lasiosphaeria hispida]